MSLRDLTLIAAICALFAACEPSNCGAGTTLKDGACVPTEPIQGCGAGTVLQGEVCVPSDAGPCVPTCAPSNACGDNGCGGSCGSCADGLFCVAGSCAKAPTCVADCVGKDCGDDGCGGSCGNCPGGTSCNAGKCADVCVPDCVAKGCGPDGCGGTCGSCDSGSVCSADQLCLPEKWTCAGLKYGNDAQCDCGCGAPDPDCDKPLAPTLGCEPLNACSAGLCTSKLPAGWKCDPLAYGDGIACHCGCGAVDPDCAKAGAALIGCKDGEVCTAGVCGACKPDCAGKVCGSDGCGGSCGGCPEPASLSDPPLACVAGKCVDGCAPKPVLCATNSCGDDGCGGTCGSCQNGEFCAGGQCEIKPGMSCAGWCKGSAPGGCGCNADCLAKGDCCPDFKAQCTCEPKCAGKSCGDDGCGGTCGGCSGDKPYCSAAGQCQTACEPQCTGKSCGSDGCGGTCGSCPNGGACNGTGECVPLNWACPDFYYADGSVCDCSCGAPDPDCAKVALTTGCPALTTCVKDSGLCSMAFCASDGDCKAPKACTGHYPAGGGLRKGICQVPNPATKPVGAPCQSDLACASGVCAGGACRKPCQQDSHCGAGGQCVGFPREQQLTGKPLGVIAACASGLGPSCASQAACAGSKQKCLAFIDSTSLKAQLRCGGSSSTADEAQSCDGTSECALGLVCAGNVCARPCPGGAGDCPAGLQCKPAILHGGVLADASDDVMVSACSK